MPNQSAELDRVFTALATPSRRAMIEQLGHGPASVTDLARPFGMSLPAVLQHVRLLQDAGLVRTEKVGRTRTCRLQDAALQRVEDWITEQRSTWDHRLDRLDAYLADTDPAPAAEPAAEPVPNAEPEPDS
jgi:DNA-binding transcriptional ArsR family regulator